VRSYSTYKHDTTLKMAFGAILFLAKIIARPPIVTGLKYKIQAFRRFN
jgi:hypothetical protein